MPPGGYRLRVPSEEEAIRRALVEYATLLDTGAWDDWADLYAEDGVHAVPAASFEVRRRANIRKWMAATYPWANTGRHMVANPLITVDGDRATAVSEVMFLLRGENGPEIGLVGEYRDVLRKTDRWRFERRESQLDESWMSATVRATLDQARAGAGARRLPD